VSGGADTSGACAARSGTSVEYISGTNGLVVVPGASCTATTPPLASLPYNSAAGCPDCNTYTLL